jgi:hypothetical protein
VVIAPRILNIDFACEGGGGFSVVLDLTPKRTIQRFVRRRKSLIETLKRSEVTQTDMSCTSGLSNTRPQFQFLVTSSLILFQWLSVEEFFDE